MEKKRGPHHPLKSKKKGAPEIKKNEIKKG